MTDREHINDQIELLETHRQTLAYYLKQAAMHGIANIPSAIEHGIRDARENIRRIKSFLRERGVSIEDLPSDELPVKTSSPTAVQTTSFNSATPVARATTLAARKAFTVDRERELKDFQKMLRQEIALRGMIFHSDGEGGWGKSSLLRMFEKECALCPSPATEALLFTPGDTGADWKLIMDRTARSLGRTYFPRYFAAVARSYADENDTYVTEESEGATDTLSIVDTPAQEIGRSASKKADRWQQSSSRFEQLPLTGVFLQELQAVPTPVQLVWLVDTVEQLDHETEVWLLKMFRRIALGELTKIILVAAGRDPLDYDPSWKGRIKRARLGPLNTTAVLQLLLRHGWDGTEHERRTIADRLIKQTRGKPHDIRLLLDNLRPELEV